MATVLLTWELGGGLGHLVNLLPLARGLRQRGHRVVAAVQRLSSANRIFDGLDVALLQAPVRSGHQVDAIPFPRSFPQLLNNCGFAGPEELGVLADAWRNIFDLVCPTLVIFDHSPIALLSAWQAPVGRVLVGTGFFCPPDEYPMRDLRPWLSEKADMEQLRQDEDAVVARANDMLAGWGRQPLPRLSQLYHSVNENFLLTLPELDHYPAGARTPAIGAPGQTSAASPQFGPTARASGFSPT